MSDEHPAPAATYCRLNRPVTFDQFSRHPFTIGAGSVVRWEPSPINGLCALRVEFAGRFATIDTDDAAPVEFHFTTSN